MLVSLHGGQGLMMIATADIVRALLLHSAALREYEIYTFSYLGSVVALTWDLSTEWLFALACIVPCRITCSDAGRRSYQVIRCGRISLFAIVVTMSHPQ